MLGLGRGGGYPCLESLEQTCHCVCFRAPATTIPLAVNLVPHSAGSLLGAAIGGFPGEPEFPESLEQNGAKVLRILHIFTANLARSVYVCIVYV